VISYSNLFMANRNEGMTDAIGGGGEQKTGGKEKITQRGEKALGEFSGLEWYLRMHQNTRKGVS